MARPQRHDGPLLLEPVPCRAQRARTAASPRSARGRSAGPTGSAKPPGLGMMLLGGPQIQEEILVGFIFLPFILLHQQMIADYFNWL